MRFILTPLLLLKLVATAGASSTGDGWGTVTVDEWHTTTCTETEQQWSTKVEDHWYTTTKTEDYWYTSSKTSTTTTTTTTTTTKPTTTTTTTTTTKPTTTTTTDTYTKPTTTTTTTISITTKTNTTTTTTTQPSTTTTTTTKPYTTTVPSLTVSTSYITVSVPTFSTCPAPTTVTVPVSAPYTVTIPVSAPYTVISTVTTTTTQTGTLTSIQPGTAVTVTSVRSITSIQPPVVSTITNSVSSSCAFCKVDIYATELVYPYSVTTSTIYRTTTGLYPTQNADGSRVTRTSITILTSTPCLVTKPTTWIFSGIELTSPTHYLFATSASYQYLFPSPVYGGCGITTVPLAFPKTDLAGLIVANGTLPAPTSAVAPTALVNYLEAQPTVETQLGGIPLSTCDYPPIIITLSDGTIAVIPVDELGDSVTVTHLDTGGM